ncbi:hypothetical protein GWI33_002242 [Rhynchophorus ferrugineus]|uniref:Uncharacterized protein n=1 Tax=Rhynchophorus ferrugineus TaxID=354439 RepID=A0A834IKK4_RHYFE|nr:hypothetical protein GWI33_002242 [Rhynchophorus ferrugineus]
MERKNDRSKLTHLPPVPKKTVHRQITFVPNAEESRCPVEIIPETRCAGRSPMARILYGPETFLDENLKTSGKVITGKQKIYLSEKMLTEFCRRGIRIMEKLHVDVFMGIRTLDRHRCFSLPLRQGKKKRTFSYLGSSDRDIKPPHSI